MIAGANDQDVFIFDPRPGARVSLLAFPCGGSRAASFRYLSRELPEWIQLIAVQYPLRGMGAAASVPAGRDEFVERVSMQIDGIAPRFALLGCSVGAKIAWELLCLRIRRGELLPVSIHVCACSSPGSNDLPAGPLESDSALMSMAQSLGGVPDYALEEPSLRQEFLRLLRADLRWALMPSTTCVAAVPIAAYGGANDQLVRPELLASWREYAGGGFQLRMFEGGHFFFNEQRSQFGDLLVRDLEHFLNSTASQEAVEARAAPAL